MKYEKIMLVVPNFCWGDIKSQTTLWHYIPYNLCLLAAILEREHYEVLIVDAYKQKMTKEDFTAAVAKEMPDYVGISVLFNMYGASGHLAAKLVKDVSDQIITQIGGVYATTNAASVIQDENIDYLISGEGEDTLPGLLDFLNGKSQKLMKGIWYKKDGVVIDGGHADYIYNLDDYPLPAYHLIDYKSYIYCAERKSTDGPSDFPYSRIFSSRGCPFNCCFCQVNKITGKNFRPRSAEHVLSEIRWLMDEYGVRSFIFDDDNFFVDKGRAIDIIKGMIPLKIKWKMIAVAAYFLDDELIELMGKSGCEYICIAIESGNERVLHQIVNKPLQLNQAKAVIKKMRSEGIFVAANFVMGFPGETWDEIRETLRFAEECQADYVKLFAAMPLPGTRLYKMAKEANALNEKYDPETLNWNSGVISTDEFSARDISILRFYEWDRINFATSEKIQRIAELMGITVDEMQQIRKDARKNLEIPNL